MDEKSITLIKSIIVFKRWVIFNALLFLLGCSLIAAENNLIMNIYFIYKIRYVILGFGFSNIIGGSYILVRNVLDYYKLKRE